MFDGSSIEGFTRIEESDMLLVPDLDTFRIFPWSHTNGKVARLICDVITPDGKPFAGCPRQTLKRQREKAKELGYTLMTGPEAEFFLFRRDAAGDPIVDTHDSGGYFDLTPVDRGEEARRDIVVALEAMGFEVEAAHHEVAPGQHEIDFKYGDAVATADNVTTFKLVVKKVAMDHGLHATFMPKPIFGVNGSGMHVHQSLLTGTAAAEERLLRPEGPLPALEDRAVLHRRHPEARQGVRGGDEPAGQLLQAAGAGLRGARQRRLVGEQPLADGPHPGAARHGDALRGPHARPGLQPLPGLRRHARGGPRRHQEQDRGRASR